MLALLAKTKIKTHGGIQNIDNLVKYRESLAKTLNDPIAISQMAEDEKARLRAQLSEIDARIQLAFGISGSGATQQQDLGALIKQALQARQQS
jgi:hypothetical protein